MRHTPLPCSQQIHLHCIQFQGSDSRWHC
uniref:Uncharacterized protein n=1 Tax=Anguilla anguilla TaxID=7936 RepID=A0A0E9UBT7_ANGAN